MKPNRTVNQIAETEKLITGYIQKLQSFYHEFMRMPSYREFADLLGFASVNAIYELVLKLEQRGVVKKDSKGKLIPLNFEIPQTDESLDTVSVDTMKKLPLYASRYATEPKHKPSHNTLSRKSLYNSIIHNAHTIKLLGLISAGFPTLAEESDMETTTLDSWIVRDPDATYMLRVDGDSMMDAGILDGDFVVVERCNTAPIGSIVVAEIDGAWTMKYLRSDEQGLYLEPANVNYPLMRPSYGFSLTAIVRGVVRKYT